MNRLVLSLFPGIDLLGRGFEEAGYCVVRGPDLLWGGDIRQFSPPSGVFEGLIAGPPCQEFSVAFQGEVAGYGVEMLAEFKRVVLDARPIWYLMENVPGCPNIFVDGYTHQRVDVRASEFGLKNRRLRHIQFGARDDSVLVLARGRREDEVDKAALASDTITPWSKFVSLQGLPPSFDIPAFTVVGKRRAVGNAVPLPVARALGAAVLNRTCSDEVRVCACSCGRVVTGRAVYAGPACRMRVMRRKRR